MVEHQTIIFPCFFSLMFFFHVFFQQNPEAYWSHPQAHLRSAFNDVQFHTSQRCSRKTQLLPSSSRAPGRTRSSSRNGGHFLEQSEFIPAIPLSIYCILHIYIYIYVCVCVYVGKYNSLNTSLGGYYVYIHCHLNMCYPQGRMDVVMCLWPSRGVQGWNRKCKPSSRSFSSQQFFWASVGLQTSLRNWNHTSIIQTTEFANYPPAIVINRAMSDFLPECASHLLSAEYRYTAPIYTCGIFHDMSRL